MKLQLMPKPIQRLFNKFPDFTQIVTNVGWLFTEKILRLGLGLFIGVWLARYLGPEQFGLLSYVTAFTSLFSSIASLGLTNIVVRDLVKKDIDSGIILGTAFVLQLCGALVVILLMVFCIVLLRPEEQYTQQMVVILGFCFVFKASDIVKCWFESKVKSRYVVLVEIPVFLMFFVIKILMLYIKAPLLYFVWLILIESFVIGCGFFVVYCNVEKIRSRWSIQNEYAKKVLSDSWPLIVSGISIALYMSIDKIMIGDIAGDGEVGLYSVAARISEVWYFIPIIICSSVFPYIIKVRDNEKKYVDCLQKLYDFLVWLAIFIAIALQFFGESLIVVLFGEEFIQSSEILKVHIWGGVLVFFGVARHRWIVNHSLQKYEIGLDALGAVSNVLLNLMLIPYYGALGAAYATIVSYVIGSVLGSLLIAELRLSLLMYAKAFIAPIRYLSGKI